MTLAPHHRKEPRDDQFTRAAPAADTYRLGRRPALDGLRAVSIIAVVAGHCGLPFTGNAGTAGVTVFFVLSGFLITRLLVEEQAEHAKIALGSFYVRRARRLLPAAAVFLVAAGAAQHVAGMSLWPVLASAANLANVATLIGMPMHLVQHMWSLSMEEQFYLVWPALLGWLLSRARRFLVPLLLGAVVVCTMWRVWLALDGNPPARIMFGPDTRSDALMIGALLAVLLPRITSWRWGSLALCSSVVLFLSLPLGPQGEWTLLPVALAASALVGWAATLEPDGDGRFLTRRVAAAVGGGPLAALGRISYGTSTCGTFRSPSCWPSEFRRSPPPP